MGGGGGGAGADDGKKVPALLDAALAVPGGEQPYGARDQEATIALGEAFRYADREDDRRTTTAGFAADGVEGDLTFSIAAGKRLALQTAPGRLSLRIDLKTEGDVYHFATLGKTGAVTFSAKEEGGRLMEGLLALLCGILAFGVLAYRK